MYPYFWNSSDAKTGLSFLKGRKQRDVAPLISDLGWKTHKHRTNHVTAELRKLCLWDDVNSGVLWNIPTVKSWKTSSSDRVMLGTWTIWPSVPKWRGQHAIRIDSNRYWSTINVDFRYQSMEINKEKKLCFRLTSMIFRYKSIPILSISILEECKFFDYVKMIFGSLKTLFFSINNIIKIQFSALFEAKQTRKKF